MCTKSKLATDAAHKCTLCPHQRARNTQILLSHCLNDCLTLPTAMYITTLPHPRNRGWPKRTKKNRSCPSGETASQTVEHIQASAGPSHVSAAVDPSYVHNPTIKCSKLLCPLCHLVINGPVQSVCEKSGVCSLSDQLTDDQWSKHVLSATLQC